MYVQHTDFGKEVITVGQPLELSPLTANSFDQNMKYEINSKKWRGDCKMNTYEVYLERIASKSLVMSDSRLSLLLALAVTHVPICSQETKRNWKKA